MTRRFSINPEPLKVVSKESRAVWNMAAFSEISREHKALLAEDDPMEIASNRRWREVVANAYDGLGELIEYRTTDERVPGDTPVGDA